MFLSCLLRSELTEGEGRPGRTSKLRGRSVEVFYIIIHTTVEVFYTHTVGQWMSSIYIIVDSGSLLYMYIPVDSGCLLYTS